MKGLFLILFLIFFKFSAYTQEIKIIFKVNNEIIFAVIDSALPYNTIPTPEQIPATEAISQVLRPIIFGLFIT